MKNRYLYVIIPSDLFSITICNLLIDLPSHLVGRKGSKQWRMIK